MQAVVWGLCTLLYLQALTKWTMICNLQRLILCIQNQPRAFSVKPTHCHEMWTYMWTYMSCFLLRATHFDLCRNTYHQPVWRIHTHTGWSTFHCWDTGVLHLFCSSCTAAISQTSSGQLFSETCTVVNHQCHLLKQKIFVWVGWDRKRVSKTIQHHISG